MAGRELSVAISFCPLSAVDPDCRLVRVVDLHTGGVVDTNEILKDAEVMEAIRLMAEELVLREAAKIHVKEVR